jgi:hypothetical protein
MELNERTDNLEDPNAEASISEEVNQNQTSSSNEETPYILPDVTATSGVPYKSKFSKWIRAVAIVVLLTFVPEQFSWAFNYNPMVLWGQKKGDNEISVREDATEAEIVSAKIASSVKHLLDQITY